MQAVEEDCDGGPRVCVPRDAVSQLAAKCPLSELLMPYNARDYSDIFGLPDRTAWMRVKALLVVTAC